MDTMTPEKRHETMSHIRGKDTSPEVIVRKYLFSRGLRYRKNDRRLPGHPDMVFPKYRKVLFVNGCFWHGHEGCRFFRIPSTNAEFWKTKIERNRERDAQVIEKLHELSWEVVTVWECQIRKKSDREMTLEKIFMQVVNGSINSHQ